MANRPDPQQLQQELEFLERELVYLQEEERAQSSLVASLGALASGDRQHVHLPLGGGIFVKAESVADVVLADVGAGVLVESTLADSLAKAESRVGDFRARQAGIRQQIEARLAMLG